MDASVPPRGGGEDGPGGPDHGGAFATGYKGGSGDMMVYGGGALTVLGVVASFVNGSPAILLASLVGSLSALYFWPTLDTRRPQLGANLDGIYVARIGVLGWQHVEALKVERRALRTMNLATLVIVLDGPLEASLIEPERVPPSEKLTARNARVSGNTVRVTLHTLAMAPDAVEARLRKLKASSAAG